MTKPKKQLYVVTAQDRLKSNSRCVISLPKTKANANLFIKQKQKLNRLSILKYRNLHNFRLRKCY